MRREFYNYRYMNLKISYDGKGVRATWGMGLRRDAHSPRPAFCFLRSIRREVSSFSRSFLLFILLIPIYSYILLIIDITYLYLINVFSSVVNLLVDKVFNSTESFHFRSFEILKGSYKMCPSHLFTEFCNEKRVLQLI